MDHGGAEGVGPRQPRKGREGHERVDGALWGVGAVCNRTGRRRHWRRCGLQPHVAPVRAEVWLAAAFAVPMPQFPLCGRYARAVHRLCAPCPGPCKRFLRLCERAILDCTAACARLCSCGGLAQLARALR